MKSFMFGVGRFRSPRGCDVYPESGENRWVPFGNRHRVAAAAKRGAEEKRVALFFVQDDLTVELVSGRFFQVLVAELAVGFGQLVGAEGFFELVEGGHAVGE